MLKAASVHKLRLKEERHLAYLKSEHGNMTMALKAIEARIATAERHVMSRIKNARGSRA
jgi:hypothetical protein